MSKSKNLNTFEIIEKYNEDFIKSISFKDIKNSRELRELLKKLSIACDVVYSYYEMLYNDFIMYINNDSINPCGLDISNIKKYRDLSNKLQKMYNYVLYILTFENPFKSYKASNNEK